MGVCGCGDYEPPSFKFKGPGNNWYVLQHYPGCSYCGTPAGVILYDMSPEDVEMFDVEHTKEQTISSGGTLIAVIHQKNLKDKLTKYLQDTAEGTADDFISEQFQEAVHESFE